MKRRSIIIICVALLALVIFAYIYGPCCCFNIFWLSGPSVDECEIVTPSDSTKVIFVRAPAHWIYAEYFRVIRLIGKDGKEVVKPLPTNTGGRTVIYVYWYEPDDGGGPYLRLLDKRGEYLVDLQEGSTKVIVRYEYPRGSGKIMSFAGDIRDKGNWNMEPSPEGVWAKVDGQPAEKLEGQLAEQPGRCLGEVIEYGEGLTFARGNVSAVDILDAHFLEFHPLPWLQSEQVTDPQDANGLE